MRRVARRVFLTVVATCCVCTFEPRSRAQTSQAATFIVNSTFDSVDTNPGNGVCATIFNDCSLRAAIQEANALPGNDTIELPEGTFMLDFGPGEDEAATGDLDITGSVSIVGTGAGRSVIDGVFRDRVFEFFGNGASYSIRGVTIKSGDTFYADPQEGGCIRLYAGSLQLTEVELDSCFATAGGGIHVQSGAMATIVRSLIHGSSATNGAGVHASGSVTIANSTIYGNSASSRGGGIELTGAGSATLTNVTISGNYAASGAAVVANASTQISVRNSIVAFSAGPAPANCATLGGGLIVSLGNNLEYPGTVCGFTSANPLLGGLADHGGPTPTVSLGATSPAIDAGDDAACAASPVSNLDQRSITRPLGSHCDVGAFEFIPPFVVNSTLDAVDATPGNGLCRTSAGVCTLRAAVQEANAIFGANAITLPPGTYTLTIPGPDDISSAAGDLNIVGGLVTVNGAGVGKTFIDGNAMDRVFRVAPRPGFLVLNDVTVQNGNAALGGCILGRGDLTLQRVVVRSCRGDIGGGLVMDATVAPPIALFMAETTVAQNVVTNAGGGLHLAAESGTALKVTIDRSTILGNTAGNFAGGISSDNGEVSITNSTISGNTATSGPAGALRSISVDDSIMRLTNVTITGNSSASLAAVLVRGPGTFDSRNSIFANSIGSAPENCDVESLTFVGLSHDNLQFPGTSCPFIAVASPDPLLGPLADNGGPTLTHALGPASPAINAGDSSTCALSPISRGDQRGWTRSPADACDLGAFEVAVPLVVTSTLDAVDASFGNGVCATSSGECTLRAAIQESNTLAGTGVITLPAGDYTLAIPAVAGDTSASSGDLDIRGGITINGAGASATIIDAGGLDRVFEFITFGTATFTYALNDLTLRNGNATAGSGGCVLLNSGSLALSRTGVTGCSAGTAGGGVHLSPSTTATITQSTISGNTAPQGGGINSQGTVTVANSTVSGNTASTGLGGGIFTGAAAGSSMALRHVTVTGNASGAGGAVVVATTALDARNTIIAGNLGTASANCATTSGGTISSVSNLEFPGATCGFSNANPQLGPLADNGGPTLTHSLGAASPAINAGNSATCAAGPVSSIDQRGAGRPAGACDVGAFEFFGPFTVTTTADAVDASPGNGVCATSGGACTLRAAVQEANAVPGANVITLGAGTYSLTIPGANEFNGATGDLNIVSGALTINGAGSATTIVDGGALDRVFRVAGPPTLTLNDLTVQNGQTNAGGCIAGGHLTLQRVRVRSCQGQDGGGVQVTASPSTQTVVNITDSAISGNAATRNGGGLHLNNGFLFGVVIATINRSTISGNSAVRGGGVHAFSSLRIANSTISGNTASGEAGGLYASSATISNSTITGNSSVTAGAVFAGSTHNVRNTIIANNLGAAPTNCATDFGSFVNQGNNIEFPGTSCGFTSVDPLLGPLADNGGPTFTHVLTPPSPAIDAGDDATCVAAPVSAVDQRGTARPLDAHCDIGSFEAPVNIRPTISFLPSHRLGVGGATGALAFTVGDVETTAANLTVSATSSNTTLVPNGNVVFGGSGANRTVTVTLAAGQCGTWSTVSVTVSDGGRTATAPFRVVCFTDNLITTLPSPITLIRRAHIVELRALLNHIRTTTAALAAFLWTDPDLLTGISAVRAQHISEMRTALAQAYVARGFSAPTFAAATLTPGVTPISRTHIEEIRNLAIALMSTP